MVQLQCSHLTGWLSKITSRSEEGSLAQLDSTYAHGSVKNYSCSLQYGTLDARNSSCTNGWTMGNIISTAAEAANFVYGLYGPDPTIVTKEKQLEMLNWTTFSVGWGLGLPYGMGTYVKALSSSPASDIAWMYGHGGADYGTYTNAHYNPMLRFALVVSTTNESYLSYDLEHAPKWNPNKLAHYKSSTSNPHAEDAWCQVLNAVLQVFSEFEGAIPGLDSTNAMAPIGAWIPFTGRKSNACYLCRICEGVPFAGPAVRRRRRSSALARRRRSIWAPENTDDD